MSPVYAVCSSSTINLAATSACSLAPGMPARALPSMSNSATKASFGSRGAIRSTSGAADVSGLSVSFSFTINSISNVHTMFIVSNLQSIPLPRSHRG